ncbi:MAG: 16S rRNA (guanine(966)-N(2))-methyltransferase RsmD [Thermostichales cyanobacterium BF4_bins_65]
MVWLRFHCTRHTGSQVCLFTDMTLRIAGRRSLPIPAGARPTAGRVRQALFNILQGQVAGSRWLDLCAGSGSIGAEALCRHCHSVVGVEVSPQAARLLAQTWQRLAQPEQSIRVILADAGQAVRDLAEQGWRFDFIYCDPPYHSPLYEHLLPQLPPLLTPTGTLIVEHHRHHPLGDPPGLVLWQQRHYGQTSLSFYQPADCEEISINS